MDTGPQCVGVARPFADEDGARVERVHRPQPLEVGQVVAVHRQQHSRPAQERALVGTRDKPSAGVTVGARVVGDDELSLVLGEGVGARGEDRVASGRRGAEEDHVDVAVRVRIAVGAGVPCGHVAQVQTPGGDAELVEGRDAPRAQVEHRPEVVEQLHVVREPRAAGLLGAHCDGARP